MPDHWRKAREKLLAEDADFSENFIMRVVLILLATIYVVVSLRVLDAFWPKKKVVGSRPTVSS
jgi:hypothetical protein